MNNLFSISEELCKRLEEEANMASEARACTGVLGIHPMSRDIKIDNFSLTFHGVELLHDTKLELSCGQRYGLIGENGSGKSSLLAVLGNREVPIQEHIDIYYLNREMPASEKTAIEAVMEADQERVRLEKLAEELVSRHDDESQEYLMEVSFRLNSAWVFL
jgi:ATP-binding cassette subfamily F protein 2